MVQEVQTSVGYTPETTLETIEAVGTSSRKIIEGRQTRGGRNISGCEATGSLSYIYSASETPKDSEYIESDDLTITQTSGDKDFFVVSKGICLPVLGGYSCELSRGMSSANWTGTIYVTVGGKTVYTNTLSVQSETVKFTFNAGKFDKLTIGGEFSYSGTSSYAAITFNPQPTLKIQQL